MRLILACIVALAFAMPAFGQEQTPQPIDRIAQLEKNQVAIVEQVTKQLNGVLAVQTAQAARIDNIDSKLQAMSDKIDALTRSQGVTFTQSAPACDGSTAFTATGGTQPQAAPPQPIMTGGYGSISASTGTCAGGSCGGQGVAARIGARLFGRR